MSMLLIAATIMMMMMMMMTTTASSSVAAAATSESDVQGNRGRAKMMGRRLKGSSIDVSIDLSTELPDHDDYHSSTTSTTTRQLENDSSYPQQQELRDEKEEDDYLYYSCTYYYGTRKKAKKAKFDNDDDDDDDKDDDWYNENCKTFNHPKEEIIGGQKDGGEEEQEQAGGPLFPPIAPVPATALPNESPPTDAPWIDGDNVNNDTNNPPSQQQQQVTSGTTSTPPAPTTVPALNPVDTESDNENDDGGIEEQDEDEGNNGDPKCDAARAGEVYPTAVSYTVYFQYELVTLRSLAADYWKGTVWPAVDELFQHYLARQLVDCTSNGDGIIHGVSPEPIDSFGSLSGKEDSGNACTKTVSSDLLLDEAAVYACDTVTGSVTIYFSEVMYMNSNNITELHLETQNKVFSYLQTAINGNGDDDDNGAMNNDNGYRRRTTLRRRRQQQQQQQQQRNMGESDFLDPDLGIYGLYFLSQPVDFLTPDGSTTAAAGDGPTLTQSVQDQSRGDGGNLQLQSSEDRSVSPAIAASIAGFTVLTMLIVGFAIHRGRRSSDKDLGEVTFIKPIETKPTDLSDILVPRDIYGEVEEEDDYNDLGEDNLPTRTTDTTTDSDSFPIQDSPNVFREQSCLTENLEDGNPSPRSSHDTRTVRDPPIPSSQERESPGDNYRSVTTPVGVSREDVITPSTAHRTMYTVDESVDEEASFDFSQDGVSMRLTSPEFVCWDKKNRRPSHSDSPSGEKLCDPPDEESKPDKITLQSQELKVICSMLDERDETPSKRSPSKRSYEQSPGTLSSEMWTTRTISVGNSASTTAILAAASQILNSDRDDDRNSTMTSRATLGMSPDKNLDLSLGSSVQPPPLEMLHMSHLSTSPVLMGGNNNDRWQNESTVNYIITAKKDLLLSRSTPTSEKSNARSARYPETASFTSPSSAADWRVNTISPDYSDRRDPTGRWEHPTLTPASSAKLDPPSSTEISRKIQSIESVGSPESQESASSRTEYLKNRRRVLEERFQRYKSRLSVSTAMEADSVVSPNDERRFVSLDRGLPSEKKIIPEEEESSPDRRCFDVPGSTPQKGGFFPIMEEEHQGRPLTSDRKERKERSRTPSRKTLRSPRDYAPLNDIEELLDRDQEWKQNDTDDSMKIDAFVSSRSRIVSLDGTEEGETIFWDESQTLDVLASPRPRPNPRLETRIYPRFHPDTIQL